MSMGDKCAICNKEIQESFLNKIKGTFIRVDGKLKEVCNECQRKYKNKLKQHFSTV